MKTETVVVAGVVQVSGIVKIIMVLISQLRGVLRHVTSVLAELWAFQVSSTIQVYFGNFFPPQTTRFQFSKFWSISKFNADAVPKTNVDRLSTYFLETLFVHIFTFVTTWEQLNAHHVLPACEDCTSNA